NSERKHDACYDYVPKLLPYVRETFWYDRYSENRGRGIPQHLQHERCRIPTNRPIARDDRPDLIYKSIEGKFRAVAEDIAERHAKGQPVLVGTVAIETSEIISKYLLKKGIKH